VRVMTKRRASARADNLQLFARLTGTCPVCEKDGKLDVTRRPRGWWIGCWVCCPPDAPPDEKREYLEALKLVTGARGDQLLGNAPEHLAPWLERPAHASVRSAEQVDEETVQQYRRALPGSAGCEYLTERRGLTPETIERFELGYEWNFGEADAITIPVRNEAGELANLRRRYLASDADPKMTGLPRRPAALYPLAVLVQDPRALVVCEGELDALLLNQHGIAAVTSTAGTTWKPEWNRYAAGRRVAVLYDAGAASYERAERRAAELVAAGAREAWPVDLTLVGFAKGEDVGDWFMTYRWDAAAMKAFLNATRRWYRAERRAA
jgi:hypothetical protein